MNRNLMLVLEAAGAALAGGSVGVLEKAEKANGQATPADGSILAKIGGSLETRYKNVSKSESAVFDLLGPDDTVDQVTDEVLDAQAKRYRDMLYAARNGRIEIGQLPKNTRAVGASIHDFIVSLFTAKVDRDGKSRTDSKDANTRVKTAIARLSTTQS